MTSTADISCMESIINRNTAEANGFNGFIEAVFYLGLNKNRYLPADINPSHAYSSFEYRLKQKPKDLACHLQRIQFSITEKNRKQLFAALCDLFITLGSHGLPLRQRLLSAYRTVLDNKQAEFLYSSLDNKFLSSESSSLPRLSYFKKAPVDLLELKESPVAVIVAVTATELDELHIAESYIENSQFDTAIEYMLAHIEQTPDNEELTIKLLHLYKVLDYAEQFKSVYHKFSKTPSTSRFWHETERYFLKK